jgi:hypothetical protein
MQHELDDIEESDRWKFEQDDDPWDEDPGM